MKDAAVVNKKWDWHGFLKGINHFVVWFRTVKSWIEPTEKMWFTNSFAGWLCERLNSPDAVSDSASYLCAKLGGSQTGHSHLSPSRWETTMNLISNFSFTADFQFFQTIPKTGKNRTVLLIFIERKILKPYNLQICRNSEVFVTVGSCLYRW